MTVFNLGLSGVENSATVRLYPTELNSVAYFPLHHTFPLQIENYGGFL